MENLLQLEVHEKALQLEVQEKTLQLEDPTTTTMMTKWKSNTPTLFIYLLINAFVTRPSPVVPSNVKIL